MIKILNANYKLTRNVKKTSGAPCILRRDSTKKICHSCGCRNFPIHHTQFDHFFLTCNWYYKQEVKDDEAA